MHADFGDSVLVLTEVYEPPFPGCIQHSVMADFVIF